MVDKEGISKDIGGLRGGLNILNAFILAQTEITDYKELTRAIVTQLDKLLNAVATVFSEYDQENKQLRIKAIKANQNIVDSVLKIGGNKFLLTKLLVDEKKYKKKLLEKVSIVLNLHEVVDEIFPEEITAAIDRALNIGCYVCIAYGLDKKLYGTSFIALRECPNANTIKLLNAYAQFTAFSLKGIKAEEALKNSQLEISVLTQNINDIVAMVDTDFNFTYLSESIYKMLGYIASEYMGKNFLELIYDKDLSIVEKALNEIIDQGKNNIRFEHRVAKKGGGYLWLETLGNVIIDNTGKINGAIFISRNITERKKAEEMLKKSEKRSRAILSTLPDIMFIYSRDGIHLDYHASDLSLLAVKPEVFLGRSVFEVLPKGTAELFLHSFKRAQEKNQIQVINYALDVPVGLRYFEARIASMDEERLIAFIRDITDRKKAEEQIKYLSFHDNFTGLYNRNYFDHCKRDLLKVPVISVIMTDLNSLKLVNDTYGHYYGDQLIKEYAKLLKQSFKSTDMIFRWGGDEFIVILKNTEEAKSWELCNRLIKHCGETYVKNIPLSISVGISSKLRGEEIDKAINEAEDKMYKNKLKESRRNKNLIMKTLLQTLSQKSYESTRHIERMSLIGKKFGQKLGLSSAELSRLETFIILHDIGQINIDSSLFAKGTTITDKEWEEIKKHPEVGYRITRTAEDFAYIAEEIYAHHERWDGKGYPRGLERESIPYLARILNIVDSYEVMSSGRPYKEKMSTEDSIEEIYKCAGKQFDPNLAGEFISFLREELL